MPGDNAAASARRAKRAISLRSPRAEEGRPYICVCVWKHQGTPVGCMGVYIDTTAPCPSKVIIAICSVRGFLWRGRRFLLGREEKALLV